MKGVVFTEFLDLVEQRFSQETVDRILDGSELASHGAYTSVGTYDHREMFALVGTLSRETGLPPSQLVHTFGHHLFSRFAESYPVFFEGVPDALALLDNVEDYIHIEVKKLYPDAELPTFTTSRPTPTTFVMEYRSERGLADLAHGLIDGCIEHFGGGIGVRREDLSADGRHVRFVLERRP